MTQLVDDTNDVNLVVDRFSTVRNTNWFTATLTNKTMLEEWMLRL